MTRTLRNVAAIAPRLGKYIAWAQSPNGSWMLLAGHWTRKPFAETYLHEAGYRIVPFAMAIDEIEVQMAGRMDRTRDPTVPSADE